MRIRARQRGKSVHKCLKGAKFGGKKKVSGSWVGRLATVLAALYHSVQPILHL